MNYRNVFLSVGLLFLASGVKAAAPQETNLNLDTVISQLSNNKDAMVAFIRSLPDKDVANWSQTSKLYRGLFREELAKRKMHQGVSRKSTESQKSTEWSGTATSGMSPAAIDRALDFMVFLTYETLHEYASEGNVDAINTLIKEYKFPVNLLNSKGETALHKAIENNKIEAINALMEAGADPLIRDNNGQTALDKATPEIRDHICKRYPDKCK